MMGWLLLISAVLGAWTFLTLIVVILAAPLVRALFGDDDAER